MRFWGNNIAEEILNEILKQCMAKGLLGGAILYTNPTHIKAKANRHRKKNVIINVHIEPSNINDITPFPGFALAQSRREGYCTSFQYAPFNARLSNSKASASRQHYALPAVEWNRRQGIPAQRQAYINRATVAPIDNDVLLSRQPSPVRQGYWRNV